MNCLLGNVLHIFYHGCKFFSQPTLANRSLNPKWWTPSRRWCLKLFLVFTPTWGDGPSWQAYVSNGLVQPPTSHVLALVQIPNFEKWLGEQLFIHLGPFFFNGGKKMVGLVISEPMFSCLTKGLPAGLPLFPLKQDPKKNGQPSLKLTPSLHLKMDAWKMKGWNVFLGQKAYFLVVSGNGNWGRVLHNPLIGP